MRASPTKHPLQIAIALGLLVAAVFGQAARFEFVDWDDDLHVYKNPLVNPPHWQNLGKIWRAPHEGLYIPVAYSTWLGVAAMAGREVPENAAVQLNPAAFHVLNLFWHLLAVLVVWRILALLVPNELAAALGAALFAIHPIQAEAVSWITGMRDLMAGVFSLAAIWIFMLAQKVNAPGRSATKQNSEPTHAPLFHGSARFMVLIALATVLFVIAILSKPSAVVAGPLALAITFVWLGRLPRAVTVLLLWIATACGILWITHGAQASETLTVNSPLLLRPAIAADTVAFYGMKIAAPLNLAIDYGRSPEKIRQSGQIAWTWIFPAAIGLLLWKFRRHRLLVLAAILFVLGMAATLGLAVFDFQAVSTVADRYVYLAMLGPALALAWTFPRLKNRWFARGILAILLALAIQCFRQSSTWRDNLTLYDHAIEVNPQSGIAHNNRAIELERRGDGFAALHDYALAVEYQPTAWRSHKNYAAALRQYLSTADSLRTAAREEMLANKYLAMAQLRQDPESAEGHEQLARALLFLGELPAAADTAQAGLRRWPHDAQLHRELAEIFAAEDRKSEAIGEYQKVLDELPGDSGAIAAISRLRQQD